MLQDNPQDTGQEDMFRARLDAILDPSHELVRLSRVIDWEALEADLRPYYCADNGRPGGSVRLMAGLIFLKEMKGLSDEELCATWRENPYFQYFSGEVFFRHGFPVEPPSLTYFRQRIGEAGMERLFQETVRAGLATGTVDKRDLEIVNVDTTVQEKAVTFPTDSRLCHKAREELVALAKSHGVKLRQSYARKGKEDLFKANKYMSARQMKRGRKHVKKLRNYLGRVMRDIERAIEKRPDLHEVFAEHLDKARIITGQTLNPKAPEKLYSWHAPEVECIAKGKAHKKYEFGCKASYAATSKSNFLVGAQALPGKPYDGHTLKEALAQITRLTGRTPKEVHVDPGYRGHGVDDEATRVIHSRQKKGITKTLRKRQRRRNAIEPIIGHCKNDRKTGPRNWLKGETGDKINAIALAIGFNMRKILAKLFLWLQIFKAICRINLTNPTPKPLF